MLLKDAGQEIAGTPHWVGVAALRDAGAATPAPRHRPPPRWPPPVPSTRWSTPRPGSTSPWHRSPPGGTTTTSSFSFTGQPALSLPLHQSEDGLPVGVQLVARRGDDERLLQPAEDLQRVTDWTTRRPSSS